MRNHSYENEFDLYENETVGGYHFHMNGFALRLVLMQRHEPTRIWPIVLVFDSMRQISDGLRIITRNPSMHNLYPWAFIERPPNEHRVLLLRTLRILSLNYDKKKHSVSSIFIIREE